MGHRPATVETGASDIVVLHPVGDGRRARGTFAFSEPSVVEHIIGLVFVSASGAQIKAFQRARDRPSARAPSSNRTGQ